MNPFVIFAIGYIVNGDVVGATRLESQRTKLITRNNQDLMEVQGQDIMIKRVHIAILFITQCSTK